MLKIANVDVYGWEAAIRGLRNPMNSWDKSDSIFKCNEIEHCVDCVNRREARSVEIDGKEYIECDALALSIGSNDLKLMKSLASAGDDHGKFLRMINVTLDITAPLYWWKEFDTYKVGTVANSCSTMHKIHAKEFELTDFSFEHLTYECNEEGELCVDWLGDLENTVDVLNIARKKFLETKNKLYWWQMIQLLPSSYNQKRTVQLNYQVLKSMYFARKDHKLDCWHTLCDWMLTLPYFKEICVQE